MTYQSELEDYLHRTVAVISEGKVNPSDLLHYVATRPAPDGEDGNKQLAELFTDLVMQS